MTGPLLIRSPWYYVAIFACLGFTSLVDRTVLAMLIEPMEKDLGISDVQAGLLIGPAFAFCYSLCAMPIAWAIDYQNRKWILITGVALWSVSTMMSAFAPNFSVLVVLRMGVAIGEAVLNPVAVSMIADLFGPSRRSLPTSVYMTSQSTGGSSSFILVGALVAAVTANSFGLSTALGDMAPWRATLFLVGLPGILLSLLMALTTVDPPRGVTQVASASASQAADQGLFRTRREALAFYAPFLVSNNLVGMMVMTTAAWFPTYLLRKHDVSLPTVGYMFGTAMLCGATVGTILIPWLVNRLTLKGHSSAFFPIFCFAIPIAALFHMAATQADGLVAAVAMIGVFFGICNGINAMPSVLISGIGAPHMRARLVATHLLLQAVFSYALGPALVPLVSRRFFSGELQPSLFALACVAFPLALVILWFARGPFARASQRLALAVSTG